MDHAHPMSPCICFGAEGVDDLRAVRDRWGGGGQQPCGRSTFVVVCEDVVCRGQGAIATSNLFLIGERKKSACGSEQGQGGVRGRQGEGGGGGGRG